MFGKLTEEEIRQAFDDIADERIKKCEGWKDELVDPALTEKIMSAIKEKYPEDFEE